MQTLMNVLMPVCAGASGARRILGAGIVKVNGEVCTDPNRIIRAYDSVTVGKHRTIQ